MRCFGFSVFKIYFPEFVSNFDSRISNFVFWRYTMRLKDKVAIVTGGGVGIGTAYAHGLAKEGAKVIVADSQDNKANKVADEIQAAGGEARAVYVDVTSAQKTQSMAQEALQCYGRIDI